jgi:predicted ArsR family transcriptional regulator
MIKDFWKRLTSKRKSNKVLTRKEQILAELGRGQGTARQLSDRLGLGLNLVRVNLSALHKEGLIRDTGVDSGSENVWEVVDG